MGPKSHETDERLDELFDNIDEAFEGGEYERALALSDEALAIDDRSVDALHYRASALAALGELEEANEAFARALKRAPDDVPILRSAAELLVLDIADHEALEDALGLLARAVKIERRSGEEEDLAALLLLTGTALDEMGEPGRALEALDEALGLSPKDKDVLIERGIALYELCRFKDAQKEFERALAVDRRDGWAHHYLGLLAERLGDAKAAAKHFADARRLAPDEFPAPIHMSPEAFDKAVEDALARLPGKVRSYLSNVSIAVEELPADEDLTAGEPPLSPNILGLYRGTPVTEQTTSDPWSHFPSSIVLYQKNLERFAKSRDELLEQVGITLIHEVGHFLGLSEEDLYERGLD